MTNQTNRSDIEAANEAARQAMHERAAAAARRADFNKPRAGTFESLNEAYAHEHDESHITWLTIPLEQAMPQLEKVAQNTRLTPQARNEDFAAIKQQAKADIETRYDNELAEIETRIAALEPKAKRAFSSDLDAAKLNYTREALHAQVSSGQLSELTLYQRWEEALTTGDLVTVQVLHDHAAAFIQATRPKGQPSTLSDRAKALLKRSNDALRSPEQKRAHAEILRLEATRWQARKAHMAALSRLENTSFGSAGMVDRREVEMRERMRQSW